MAGLAASRPQQLAWLRQEMEAEDDVPQPVPECSSTVGHGVEADASPPSEASPAGRRLGSSLSFWRKSQRAREKEKEKAASSGSLRLPRGRWPSSPPEAERSEKPAGPSEGEAYDPGHTSSHDYSHAPLPSRGYSQAELYEASKGGAVPSQCSCAGCSYAAAEQSAYSPERSGRGAERAHRKDRERDGQPHHSQQLPYYQPHQQPPPPPQQQHWSLATRPEDDEPAGSSDEEDERERAMVAPPPAQPRPGSLAALLSDSRLRGRFEKYLEEDDALNALRFCKAVQEYKKQMLHMAAFVFDTFVAVESTNSMGVDLPPQLFETIEDEIASKKLTYSTFELAYMSIYDQLELKELPRFLELEYASLDPQQAATFFGHPHQQQRAAAEGTNAYRARRDAPHHRASPSRHSRPVEQPNSAPPQGHGPDGWHSAPPRHPPQSRPATAAAATSSPRTPMYEGRAAAPAPSRPPGSEALRRAGGGAPPEQPMPLTHHTLSAHNLATRQQQEREEREARERRERHERHEEMLRERLHRERRDAAAREERERLERSQQRRHEREHGERQRWADEDDDDDDDGGGVGVGVGGGVGSGGGGQLGAPRERDLMQPPSDDDATDYNVDDMLEMHGQLHEAHEGGSSAEWSPPGAGAGTARGEPMPREPAGLPPHMAPSRCAPAWGPHTPTSSPPMHHHHHHPREPSGPPPSVPPDRRPAAAMPPSQQLQPPPAHATRPPGAGVASSSARPPVPSVCGSTYTSRSRRTVASHTTSSQLSAAPTLHGASARAPATLGKSGGRPASSFLSPEESAWEADTW